MSQKIIGIKLGGSDITQKDTRNFPFDILDILNSGEKYLKVPNIIAVAKSIHKAMTSSNQKFVLVHGAGVFGHSLVGNVHPRIVRRSMQFLNLYISSIFEREGIRVQTVSPFEYVEIIEDRKKFDMSRLLDEVNRLLDTGIVPICHGDMAPFIDDTNTFGVVSGDDVLPAIGEDPRMPMDKMIMLSKYHIHTHDPKLKPDARTISEIQVTAESFDDAIAHLGIAFGKNPQDKSGGMAGKAAACYAFTYNTGRSSYIVPFSQVEDVFNNKDAGTKFIK